MTIRTDTQSLSRVSSLALNLAMTTAGALALALLAQARIKLYPDMVPITLQVFGIFMLGGLLGPRLGVLAVVEYLILGICGVPVCNGFTSILGCLLTHNYATFGYLLAFLPATALYGFVFARFRTRSYSWRLCGGMLAALLTIPVIYLGGWAWLVNACHVPEMRAFTLGIAPFLVPDLLKAGVAAAGLALWEKGAKECSD